VNKFKQALYFVPSVFLNNLIGSIIILNPAIMNKEINDLYSDYKKGLSSRRKFIKKLAIITGSSAAAMTLLPVLEANEINAATHPEQESDLVTEFIKYPAETGEMKAFLARPKKGNKFPAVIVIHENRGLVPHIQDVTRRMAKEGFLSLAPDALSPLGGTPEDVSNVGEMFKKLDNEKTIKNFVAAVKS
jgi:carboxymethylenebutenolidase